MLKNVKISNFGPINEEIIFTMEKGKTIQFPENVIEGTNLLKTILIYGENNSGKSRFISAFSMLRELIVDGKKMYNGLKYSRNLWLDNYISSFSFSFIIDKKEYLYVININFIKKIIDTEILMVDNKLIFLRFESKVALAEHLINAKIDTSDDFKMTQDLSNYVEKNGIEVNPEISYITSSFNKVGEIQEINTFYEYIKNIVFIDQQRKNEVDFFYEVESPLINYVEENKNKINEILFQFGFDLQLNVDIPEYDINQEKQLMVVKTQNNLKLEHLLFFTESFGTITFIKLILTALSQSDKSFLMIIDEIERGVHPLLVANFIKYMNKYFPNVQLILPTHMTDLLSIDLNLRKDQIYITDITDGAFSIKRTFNKKHIRENMNFQKILKSNAVGGNPEININSENKEI